MNYHIIESEFNKKLSTAYQLSILAGMDSLVYFVFDAGKEDALLLKSHPFQTAAADPSELKKQLEGIFSRDELLAYLYRRVKIILPVGPSVIVPERLYNEAEKATYYKELCDVKTSGPVQADEISELGIRVLYPAEPELNGVLKKQFPTAKFYSPATPFLLGCWKLMEDSIGQAVFVHLHKETIFISLFDKQRLLFFNSFSYGSAGDVLYFVLLVFNQFKLEPALIPVNLSGHVVEDSEIYKMLYRYIGHLQFQKEPPFLKFSKRFSEVPPHFYFNLYSLALCK